MPSLDDFVQLPENVYAYEAVVRSALSASVPLLFLHGPPGSGKSHLVRALVEQVTQADPSKNALVLAAAEIGRMLTQPPLQRQPASREAIRADLSIIEDLQYLPAAAGDAIAHILDRRQRSRRSTMMTASRGPGELDLPARLVSRLTGGLVVGIQPLAEPSRRTLAATVCRQRDLKVADDVITWLARDPGGARPILGQVSRLEELAKHHRSPLTLEVVTAELPAMPDEPSPLDRIAALVASQFHVDVRAMRGPSRQKNIAWPRQVAMYVARQAGYSLPQIGAYFGGRDHTTVMHSCDKVASLAVTDASLTQRLRELQASVRRPEAAAT